MSEARSSRKAQPDDRDRSIEPNPAADDATVHHQSARQRRDMAPARMQLNLTSMIDVIFLLLIYFVITASFTQGEGVVTARLPAGTGTGATPEPEKRPLRITVSDVGAFDYRLTVPSASPANFEELGVVLEQLQFNDRNPNGVYRDDDPVLIAPTGQVRWQHVVNAFNAAIKARYRNVSFAQPDAGEG